MFDIAPDSADTSYQPNREEPRWEVIEAIFSRQLSRRMPHVVRVVIPQGDLMRMLDAMHTWALMVVGNGYTASPFRDFSDLWNPIGSFKWHFKSEEAALRFAVQFSGELVA